MFPNDWKFHYRAAVIFRNIDFFKKYYCDICVWDVRISKKKKTNECERTTLWAFLDFQILCYHL